MNSKKSTYSFVILILGFMVAFAGSYPQFQLSALSYLIIPNLNLSISQFSSIFSGSMVPGILLSLVSGLLCDRFGVKRCISFAGLVASAGTILRIWSFNYITLLICMVLSGVGASFLNSNISKLLSKWVPAEKIGTMIGIVLAGTTASQVVGMATTAYFPSVNSAYIVAAMISVLVAVLWILFAKEAPSGLGSNEKVVEIPKQSLMDNLKIVIRNPHIWCVGICLMFMLGSIIALSAFLPLALQSECGFSAQSAGTITSVIMGGSLVGTIVGPIWCEKSGNLKIFLCVFGMVAGLGTAFAWTLPIGVLMLVAMFITGFTSNAIVPIMISIPIRLNGISFECAGTAGGVVATIQLLGAIMIPTYIISPIAGSNYSLFFILAGVSAALCGLVAFALPNLKKQ